MARYTYSPGYVDSPAVQERDLNADDDFGDSGEVVYYHSNTLYSVYSLSDGSENVAERYRYSAYGQSTVLDADWSADADAASDAENPYRYTARRVDPETGLMQYRNRYYAPQLGRFISRDPAELQAGVNQYAGHSIPQTGDWSGLGCNASFEVPCEFRWGEVRPDVTDTTWRVVNAKPGKPVAGGKAANMYYPICVFEAWAIIEWECRADCRPCGHVWRAQKVQWEAPEDKGTWFQAESSGTVDPTGPTLPLPVHGHDVAPEFTGDTLEAAIEWCSRRHFHPPTKVTKSMVVDPLECRVDL